MRIVTAQQMKAIEHRAGVYGIDEEQLMENAGTAAAVIIRRAIGEESGGVTIFCGSGNNGGDGFVAARRLREAGLDVAVILTDGMPRSPQAQTMLTLVEQMEEIPVMVYGEDPQTLTQRLAATDFLVDAIYGTGFHGMLDERHRDICRLMNGMGARVFALDIPSGVSADTGRGDEYAVRAAVTIVFDSDKPATVMPAAAEFCGEVLVADIGIPPEAHEGIVSGYELVDRGFVFDRLPKRRRDTHKGSYGKLLNIAGSRKYTGAAVLSSLAAMRTGAGYVTLASTSEVCKTAFPLLLESVMLPLEQTEEGGISYVSMAGILEEAAKSTAILIGNGLGTGEDACRIVYELLETVDCPIIVDADGINIISRNIDILRRANCKIVLTPHLKELSRLTTLPTEQLKQDALSVGVSFAQYHQVTLVLKDAYTTTVTPAGQVYINTTGNAGLAKAGSGDVLAGIIGGLVAQGYSPETAAVCGVWLHGLAGDCAAQSKSQYGMLARDVIHALPEVFRNNGR